MSKVLRLFLGYHLKQSLSSFSDIKQDSANAVMCKVKTAVTFLRHHKRKMTAMPTHSIIVIGIFPLRTEISMATMLVSE
tara:strand:+ start:447 stop:683 length:237 start_codon:yes stop_codon:yes gene_type:complete